MSGSDSEAATIPSVAWVIVDRVSVPERWADRALDVAMIPLLADEFADLLNGDPVSKMDGTDEELLRLIGAGLSSGAIAQRLRISERTVDRRIARLKDRFGAASRFDLAKIAAVLPPKSDGESDGGCRGNSNESLESPSKGEG